MRLYLITTIVDSTSELVGLYGVADRRIGHKTGDCHRHSWVPEADTIYAEILSHDDVNNCVGRDLRNGN